MAIVLAEEKLLDRSQIYATDIDAGSLEEGRAGSYGLERVRSFSQSYYEAGGTGSLSEHYTTTASRAVFVPRLRERILFSDHSLATDSVFAEVHLVSCRNVLIYFDHQLQDHALGLMTDALCRRGFLGLGARESLQFSAHRDSYEALLPQERWYQKC